MKIFISFILLFPLWVTAQTKNVVLSLPHTNAIYKGFDNIIEIGFSKKILRNYTIDYAGCDTFYHLSENQYVVRASESDSIVSLKILFKNKVVETVQLKSLEMPTPMILINSKYTREFYLDTIPVIFNLVVPTGIPLQHNYQIKRWQISIDDKLFKGVGKMISSPMLVDYLKNVNSHGKMIVEIEYSLPYRASNKTKTVREVWLYSIKNQTITDE